MTIYVEVPGCGPRDVTVTLEKGIIKVQAQTALSAKTLQFRVGGWIDVGDITAVVKNGLLTLTAKADQQSAPPQGTVHVTQG